MDYKDYYKTLGVKRDASADEIKSAYRRLARKHHPDVNPGDKTAGTRFKEINEAYEVLSDPDKKSRYDMWGRIPGMTGTPAGGRGTSPFGVPNFGGPRTQTQQAPGEGSRTRSGAGNLGDFSDFFHTLFGQGNATPRGGQPQKGADIEQSVEIPLEEVMTGGQRVFSIRGQDRCPKCLGTTESPPGTLCAHCSGTGVVDYTRKIEVKIPQGVREGSRIRIAGEGQPGTYGGPKGDLFLIVHIRAHASFTRDEDNLQTDVDVPFTRLILGGEIEAPTLKGRVVLKIPPQTQNGRIFRLSGKGLPKLKGTGNGDLLIRLRATLPTVVTPRMKELVEQIDQLEPAVH